MRALRRAAPKWRIADIIDSEDIDIYRQLAGGVTSSHILHGSANPIGGQTQLIKLRWGYAPEEMKIQQTGRALSNLPSVKNVKTEWLL